MSRVIAVLAEQEVKFHCDLEEFLKAFPEARSMDTGSHEFMDFVVEKWRGDLENLFQVVREVATTPSVWVENV